MVDGEAAIPGLELEWDEAEHVASVPEDVGDRIALTAAGAVLTLSGIATARLTLSEPKGLLSLLLAKSAQDLRFASIGMSLGYYSGVYALLRGALESLSYASLFDSDPDQIGRFVKNTLSSGPRDHRADARLRRRARRSLIKREKDRAVIDRGMTELWDHANKHIHSTLQGLAHQFDIEVDDLIPNDLFELLGNQGMSVELALSSFMDSTKHDGNLRGHKNQGSAPMELIPIEFGVRFDDDMLDKLSMFAFYISHRSLDLARSALEISDPEFNKNYERWHRDLADT